jgi:short-subunit dehydrogenase
LYAMEGSRQGCPCHYLAKNAQARPAHRVRLTGLRNLGKLHRPRREVGVPTALATEFCMRRDLKGLRVLLTGASSGIGRALAGQLAQSGARVVLAARSLAKLQEIERSLTALGLEVAAVSTDVTSDSDRRGALNFTVERLGGLDILVNNAGIGSFGHFVDCTEDVLRQVMEVNFFAPAELIRLAIPHLAKGQQPAIVNVASMCGRRGLPAWSEYSASKFALTGLSEALRAELAHFGIDVVVIQPGRTRSDLGSHLLRNTGRMPMQFDQGMPPEEVAAGIVSALTRGRHETVLGGEAKWMLRLNRWVPRILDRLIARKIRQLYAQDAANVTAKGA